jgi:hypothetical protein
MSRRASFVKTAPDFDTRLVRLSGDLSVRQRCVRPSVGACRCSLDTPGTLRPKRDGEDSMRRQSNIQGMLNADVPERVNAVGAKPARTVDASQSAKNAKIAVCRKPLRTPYCKPAIVADPYPRSVRLVKTSPRASFARNARTTPAVPSGELSSTTEY